MDVYLDRNEKMWILDFNPLPKLISEKLLLTKIGSTADFSKVRLCSSKMLETPPHPPLVTWKDLVSIHQEVEKATVEDDGLCLNEVIKKPEFRFMKSEEEANKHPDVFSAHRVPIDLVNGDLSTREASQLDEMLERVKLQHETQNEQTE